MCVKSSVGCDFCKVLDIYKEAYQGKGIYVVIKPEFSKFPKKIEVWSLSSSRCKFSVSVDFVS